MISFRLITLAVLLTTSLGCRPSTDSSNFSAQQSRSANAATSESDVLTQFSLLAALAADDYTGGPPLREVLKGGDFGIGTFDNLDGEMIVLNGVIFQAQADGSVRAADLEGTTPFAVVTYFNEDGRIADLEAASLTDLDEHLDHKLPRPNSPYAIRLDGEFAELTLRSVPAQKPPFRPLVEVVKDQVTWKHVNLRGTLVGIRCPEWMKSINVAGYHWHFLSEDHKVGGHVLGCAFDGIDAVYDECSEVMIHIPKSAEFDRFQTDAVSEDDIKQIERQRTSGTKGR